MTGHEILWPTDFSDLAEDAARVARQDAERFAARIRLFHLLWSGEYDVTRLLAQIRETLRGVPGVIATTAGDPAEKILRWATAPRIDLIVLGTHGRTGLSRALFGSV
jgi:nucleotide-binding universal stress UspA family protein